MNSGFTHLGSDLFNFSITGTFYSRKAIEDLDALYRKMLNLTADNGESADPKGIYDTMQELKTKRAELGLEGSIIE